MDDVFALLVGIGGDEPFVGVSLRDGWTSAELRGHGGRNRDISGGPAADGARIYAERESQLGLPALSEASDTDSAEFFNAHT